MPLYINPKTGISTEDPNNGVLLDTYNPSAQSPTAGEVYGGVVNETPEEKAAREAVGQNYQSDAGMVVNEDEIRGKTTQRFQAEIDALNNIYADKIRVANVEGQGRLGETGAVQARRGLLGSDFGGAMTEKTRSYNNEIVGDIQDEKSGKLSAIYKNINDSVTRELESKTAAKKLGAENYLKFIRETGDRKKTYVADTVKKLVSSGETPDNSIFQSIADQLGTSIEDVKANYAEQNKAYQEAIAKSELEKKQTETDIAYKNKQINQFDIDNTFTQKEIDAKKAQDDFNNSLATGEFNLKKSELKSTLAQRAFENGMSIKELQLKRDMFKSDEEYNNSKLLLDQIKAGKESSEMTVNEKIALQDKGYKIDESGNVVPNSTSDDKLKKATDVVQQIDDLLASNWTKAVGPLDSVMPGFTSGERNTIRANIESLINNISLDNLPMLKGPMSDRDIEFIKGASAGLNTNMDEAGFKAKLDKIRERFDRVKSKAELQKQFPGATPDELDALYDEEKGFSQVGGDTNSATLKKAVSKQDGTKGGQCGRFVNNLTGIGVGDSYKSKMSKMDPTIKKPEPGMVFTMPYKQYGHVGIIVAVNGDKVTVKDSNYGLDETVKTHELPISKITGLARV